jgi:GMP synthase-like glutamine amidotransferase
MVPSVCYLSMLCEEGASESAICSLHPDGSNDGEWLAARLREMGLSKRLQLTTLRISRGDALPDVSAFDAVILGGTFHGVYDGRPWQRLLGPWLLAQRATGKPLLGICGGHQAMVVALGGKVAKRPAGTQVGSVAVRLTQAGARHPLFTGVEPAPRFHFGNSDEVTFPPPGATVLATTADSPSVALDYGGGWCSVQFHPEASEAIFQHWVGAGVLKAPAVGEAFRPLGTGRRLLSNFLLGEGLQRARHCARDAHISCDMPASRRLRSVQAQL